MTMVAGKVDTVAMMVMAKVALMVMATTESLKWTALRELRPDLKPVYLELAKGLQTVLARERLVEVIKVEGGSVARARAYIVQKPRITPARTIHGCTTVSVNIAPAMLERQPASSTARAYGLTVLRRAGHTRANTDNLSE